MLVLATCSLVCVGDTIEFRHADLGAVTVVVTNQCGLASAPDSRTNKPDVCNASTQNELRRHLANWIGAREVELIQDVTVSERRAQAGDTIAWMKGPTPGTTLELKVAHTCSVSKVDPPLSLTEVCGKTRRELRDALGEGVVWILRKSESSPKALNEIDRVDGVRGDRL